MDHERVFVPLDLNDVTTNAYDDPTIYHQQHESGRGYGDCMGNMKRLIQAA